MMDKINFTVNGESYSLSGSEVSPLTSLNDYLRNYLRLHGTKAMCHEGGCGACIVSVSLTHPSTKEKQVFAVNSCLVHILSCHQWDITTIEGIGNRKDGYHPIQNRLATFNGTQCGYCTPGWVMNMYSLYEGSSRNLSTYQVESSFGGNMCRCTGYRPILDAFKSFADTDDPLLRNKIQDVEDLHTLKCLKKCKIKEDEIEDWCMIDKTPESLMQIKLQEGGRWYKANSINDVFKVLTREGSASYRFIAGNTGQGVYPIEEDPKVLIDISSIETLRDSNSDVNLILGAGMTLTDVMKIAQKWANKDVDFKYMEHFYQHLNWVAHVPVRNLGSIGGNLALKNAHHEFPSDIFLLLATVGATITMVNKDLNQTEMKMQEFLKLDLRNKLILNVKLPPLSSNCLLQTYKIMPRAQNSHAIVNAGFLFRMDSSKKVVSANIVYGSITPDFIKAKETANTLVGQNIFTDETLQKALNRLRDELAPVDMPPEPSPLCRKTLALGLFYKAILSLAPAVNPRYKSGGSLLERGISSGTQNFDTDKSLWPLNQPIPKLEALTQCAGEARYACDIDASAREVFVAFVLSDVCRGEILGFDTSLALKIPGVIAFFSAKDFPGKNCYTPSNVPMQEGSDEILASKTISYYGQPVGLIVAVNQKLALSAAKLVKLKCKKLDAKPVLSVKDALVAPDKSRRIREDVSVKARSMGLDTSHVIKGGFSIGGQYHYTMETQCCTVAPTENGLSVRSSTQWMDLVQVVVAQSLGIDENRVVVSVDRIGGGYGGKATRSALVACSAALVAHLLNRRATLVMPLTHNMTAIGMRAPCDANYEVGINSDGVIQYLTLSYYSDNGYSFSDTPAPDIVKTLTNLYDTTSWNIKGYSVLTDKPSSTWCRGPSTTEATAILEHIMERISYTIQKDATSIKLQNLQPKHSALKDMITSFEMDTNFQDRRVEIAKYNAQNAWKKKGLKMAIMAYPIEYGWSYAVTVSVYHGDGTVVLAHGGIEMGQGINTKAAQVCAYTLKIPLDKIVVRGSDSFVSPNATATNGSITSDSVAFATVKTCEMLLDRLGPIKSEMKEPTWEELVQKAFDKGVNLQASYMASQQDSLVGYDVYGVCATEVELDVLTGNHQVTRVDLVEDTGVSLSPDIDVGQIEGAFTMGLGLWTSEHLVYERSTGRLLTDRTWTYKPPGAKDIPADFRVSFRRNAPNPTGVLRSKATGEPALVLAVSVIHALHETIVEARKEFGYNDIEWVTVGTPYTVENILTAISPKIENYKIQ